MNPIEIHQILTRIGAKRLHHANTVTTSCTFLEQSGLLSRGRVERDQLTQTSQNSDAIDKKYGIWNAVFLDHVNIHYRAGRVKGPNQYGPVLFILDVDILLRLPEGTDVGVTRSNPVHWRNNQAAADRWYLGAEELSQSLNFGDFDKMLVISTPEGRVSLPDSGIWVKLDNPKRNLSDGSDAYLTAEKRLAAAATVGRIAVEVAPHECRSECLCEVKDRGYGQAFFDSRFL